MMASAVDGAWRFTACMRVACEKGRKKLGPARKSAYFLNVFHVALNLRLFAHLNVCECIHAYTSFLDRLIIFHVPFAATRALEHS